MIISIYTNMDITIYEYKFRYLNIYVYTYIHKAQEYRGYRDTYRTTVQRGGAKHIGFSKITKVQMIIELF